MHNHSHVPLWQTRGGVVLLGFLAIAAFYLLSEHTAHVFGALPYLLILACPLMHCSCTTATAATRGSGSWAGAPRRAARA
jgi:Protein of unknown function (DUF2933)